MDTKKKLIIAGCTLGGLAAGYLIVAGVCANRFAPGTKINGINVSFANAKGLDKLVKEYGDNYAIDIIGRDGKSETVYGREVGLKARLSQNFDELIADQNCFAWPLPWLWGDYREVDQSVEIDHKMFDKRTRSLNCADPDNMKEAVNIALSDYDETNGYRL